MTRYTFGGGATDFAVRPSGLSLGLLPGSALSMWSAQTGGTQYTDLILVSTGAAITTVTSDPTTSAIPQFQGPSDVTAMWADGGYGRFRLSAFDVTTVLSGNLPAGLTGGSTFDASRSVYGSNGNNLLVARAWLTNPTVRLAGGQFRVCCIGDSTTQGYSPTPAQQSDFQTTSWPNQLTNQLLADGYPMGDSGVGLNITPSDTRIVLGGSGWATTVTTTQRYISSSHAGDTFTFTSRRPCQYIEFGYFDGPAAAAFTYSVDGGSATTVTPGNTGKAKALVTSQLDGRRAHSITVTVGSGGALVPKWIDAYSNPNVCVANFGSGGSSIQGSTGTNPQWDASSASTPTILDDAIAWMHQSGLAVAIVDLGVNDVQYGGTTAAQLQTALSDLVGKLIAASVAVILVAPHPIVGTVANFTTALRQVYYTVADQYGVPLLDLQDRWVSAASANFVGFLGNDTEVNSTALVHPTPAGYVDIAQAVRAVIGVGAIGAPSSLLGYRDNIGSTPPTTSGTAAVDVTADSAGHVLSLTVTGDGKRCVDLTVGGSVQQGAAGVGQVFLLATETTSGASGADNVGPYLTLPGSAGEYAGTVEQTHTVLPFTGTRTWKVQLLTGVIESGSPTASLSAPTTTPSAYLKARFV